MATRYVENVPKELYEALRSQAKARRSSIMRERGLLNTFTPWRT